MSRQPWMKFFPSDWRADPALRSCGFAARGLWIEMLAIMHEAAPRGHLLINSRAVTNRQLAAVVGGEEAEVSMLLSELEESGVFSRKKNGVIFSRRMEKEENRSRKNRENGKNGGNPSLCNKTENDSSVNRKDNPYIPEARSQIPDNPPSVDSPPAAKPATKCKRATRIPQDWEIGERERTVAAEEGVPAGSVEREFKKFKLHFENAKGQRGTMLDWGKAWRKWCVNAVEWAPNRNSRAPPKAYPDRGGFSALYHEALDDLRPTWGAPDDQTEYQPDDIEPAEPEILAPERSGARRFGDGGADLFRDENRTGRSSDVFDL